MSTGIVPLGGRRPASFNAIALFEDEDVLSQSSGAHGSASVATGYRHLARQSSAPHVAYLGASAGADIAAPAGGLCDGSAGHVASSQMWRDVSHSLDSAMQRNIRARGASTNPRFEISVPESDERDSANSATAPPLSDLPATAAATGISSAPSDVTSPLAEDRFVSHSTAAGRPCRQATDSFAEVGSVTGSLSSASTATATIGMNIVEETWREQAGRDLTAVALYHLTVCDT